MIREDVTSMTTSARATQSKRAPHAITFAAVLAAGLGVAAAAQATPLNLRFDNFDDNTSFHTAGNLEMRYLNVAEGLNATITAVDSFYSNNPNNHGSIKGDATINMGVNERQTFRFSLYDATVGSGFDQLFTSTEDFEYTLAFFDIDGTEDLSRGSWDALWIDKTVAHRTSATTVLDPTEDGDFIKFSGKNTMANVIINSPSGLGQDGRDSLVLVDLFNQNTFDFAYGVETEAGVIGRAGRNLYIDGFNFNTLDPGPPKTPLPAGMVLILTAMGGLGLARKHRARMTQGQS